MLLRQPSRGEAAGVPSPGALTGLLLRYLWYGT